MTLIHNSRAFFLCGIVDEFEISDKICLESCIWASEKNVLIPWNELIFWGVHCQRFFFFVFPPTISHLFAACFFFARQIDVRKDLGFSCNLFVRSCVFVFQSIATVLWWITHNNRTCNVNYSMRLLLSFIEVATNGEAMVIDSDKHCHL